MAKLRPYLRGFTEVFHRHKCFSSISSVRAVMNVSRKRKQKDGGLNQNDFKALLG